MTNNPMGPQVLPNQGIKAQITEYKVKTVDEIISVAPRLAGGEAVRLYKRAEDFTRPLPPPKMLMKYGLLQKMMNWPVF